MKLYRCNQCKKDMKTDLHLLSYDLGDEVFCNFDAIEYDGVKINLADTNFCCWDCVIKYLQEQFKQNKVHKKLQSEDK